MGTLLIESTSDLDIVKQDLEDFVNRMDTNFQLISSVYWHNTHLTYDEEMIPADSRVYNYLVQASDDALDEIHRHIDPLGAMIALAKAGVFHDHELVINLWDISAIRSIVSDRWASGFGRKLEVDFAWCRAC